VPAVLQRGARLSGVVAFSASATDNCDTNPVVNCIPVSGAMFALGANLVTCTATDGAGNTNSCSFTVTVRDKHGLPSRVRPIS
jgi:hypothetical protein